MEQATHTVSLGGETVRVNQQNIFEACDQLVAKYGGKPVVNPIVQTSVVTRPTPVPPRAPAAPVGENGISEAGRARSEAACFELRANGFAPKPPVYAVGSRVNEWGVRNAESSREEFEKLPRVSESCGHLIEQVNDEHRMDVLVDRFSSMRLDDNGLLHRGKQAIVLSEHAFGGLVSRAGIGGHAYLAKCPTALRATNVNYWMQEAATIELAQEADTLSRGDKSWKPKDAKLRTRISRGEREIFSLVSGGYGSFDVDKIAQSIAMATPPDARGSVVYDGYRAKFEVLFHSNIQPKDYVAGEFFKAGVLVRSSDDGSGSIRVSAVVWQNLCLNLIILDECVQQIAAIRHVGSVEALADKFRDAFKKALGSIDQFIEKWGFAVRDDVLVPHETSEDFSIDALLPGLFNGIIERELVPVRGERKQVVKDLVRMHDKDDSGASPSVRGYLSRAAVVNAFTRYAHEVNDDPFAQEEIERAAGSLLKVTRANATLPYEPIDF